MKLIFKKVKTICYPNNLNFVWQVAQLLLREGSDFALQNDYERFQVSTVHNPAVPRPCARP